MTNRPNSIAIDNISIGNHLPITYIIGLNALESERLVFDVASEILQITQELGVNFIFKVSIDKANRSAIDSFRGIGIEQGVAVLKKLKTELDVKVITDVHLPEQAQLFAEAADILQLPAFLARQTDLVKALAKTNKPINIKKPQFLSPQQMQHIVTKFHAFGNDQLLLCERGTNFGYDNLVVDFLGFQVMRQQNNDIPIVFDVTHSLQMRGGGAKQSGGRSDQLLGLAKAGVATGIASLFIEVHPDPANAKCDGPSALKLSELPSVLKQLTSIDNIIKSKVS